MEIAVYFSTSCFNLFMIFNFNTNRPFVLFLSWFIILTLSTKWIVSRNYELVLLHVCVYIFRLLTKYLQAKCYYMYNVLWSSWFTYYVCLKCAFDRNYGISEDCMQWKCKHTLDNFAGIFSSLHLFYKFKYTGKILGKSGFWTSFFNKIIFIIRRVSEY